MARKARLARRAADRSEHFIAGTQALTGNGRGFSFGAALMPLPAAPIEQQREPRGGKT